ATSTTVKWSDGAVLRNATKAYRYGNCTRYGDSGAPIYRIKSDGTVQAKGILSGGSTNLSGDCIDYFTDTYLGGAPRPAIINPGEPRRRCGGGATPPHRNTQRRSTHRAIALVATAEKAYAEQRIGAPEHRRAALAGRRVLRSYGDAPVTPGNPV